MWLSLVTNNQVSTLQRFEREREPEMSQEVCVGPFFKQ